MEQPHTDRQPDPGPLTTRIVGELAPPEEPRTPAHPAPEQLEVTQPYIPAIRDEAPEFAKRLSPQSLSPQSPRPRTTPSSEASAGAATAVPVDSPRPSAGQAPPAATTRTPGPAATGRAVPRRRSLARRVVRRIIGPDLLRKDPKPKR